jgi:SAM-dependent methyltransferase
VSGTIRDHEGREIDFGRTADDYTAYRPGLPDEFYDRLLRLGWIRAGQRALDLGTGTGAVALGLARRGLEVTGIDLAEPLLDSALRTAAAEALNARFVHAPAEATGEPDASFDLVSSCQAWWWFDGEAAMREALRVLAPGGRLLLCAFSYLALPGTAAGRTEDLILRHNPGWPKAGWRGVHPEWLEALDLAGFGEVESYSFVAGVPFTHEGWRGRMRTCNGVGAALPPEQVECFDADLAALLAAEFPGGLVIPHRVFAASGVKA